MQKDSIFKKTLFFSGIFLAVVTVFAVCASVLFSFTLFKTQARQEIEQFANEKRLEFQASLEGQILLALQLAKSSIVIDYFSDVDDAELKSAAIRECSSYQNSFLGKTIFWVADADKEFWSDCKYSYTVDPSNPSEYWYKMTMEETDVYNFNINYNSELNTTSLWVNAVVRNEVGNAIGIIGTGIPLSDFVASMYENLPAEFSMYLYNSQMEITGATDQTLIVNKEKLDTLYPKLNFPADLPKTVEFLSDSKGEYVLCPIPEVSWTIFVQCKKNFLQIITGNVSFAVLLVWILATVIIVSFVIFIVKILQTMNFVLIGTKNEAVSQNALMNSVNKALVSNNETLQGFGDKLKDENEKISQSTLKTDELNTNLNELNDLRADSMMSTTDLETSSKAGLTHISNVNSKIEELATCMDQLGTANNVIAGITSRTNLLAMNASIEAAHAGEHGKGFAVVANEVRNLAARSKEQQQGVARSIEHIKKLVGEMVEYSATAQKSFTEITEDTRRVQENFSRMSEKLNYQTEIGRSITQNLSIISESSRGFMKEFNTMWSANEVLGNEVEQVLKNSLQLVKTTEETLESTELPKIVAGKK